MSTGKPRPTAARGRTGAPQRRAGRPAQRRQTATGQSAQRPQSARPARSAWHGDAIELDDATGGPGADALDDIVDEMAGAPGSEDEDDEDESEEPWRHYGHDDGSHDADEADEDEDEWGEDEDDGSDRDDDLISAEEYLQGEYIPLATQPDKRILVMPMSLTSMIQRTARASAEGKDGERYGGVPNSLLPAAERMVFGKASPTTRREKRHGGASVPDSTTQTEDAMALTNFLVCKLVDSPRLRVVRKPQSQCGRHELSIFRMHDADKFAIVEFSLKGQAALATFR